MSFVTHIKKVKSMGVAGNGVGPWWQQRKTALILIPLVFWFVWVMLSFMFDQQEAIVGLLYSPFKLLCFVILLNVSLYHGMLGMKEIFEDYIHNEMAKLVAIFLLQNLTWLVMLATSGMLLLNFLASR